MSRAFHFERILRSLPLWLLQEYLEELGGDKIEDGRVRGDGWTARLEQIEDFQVGSLKVGQVYLDVEIDLDKAQGFVLELEKKLLRAGG